MKAFSSGQDCVEDEEAEEDHAEKLMMAMVMLGVYE